MRNPFQYSPADKDNAQTTQGEKSNSQEEVTISLPRTDRPEGPFEHSGETARQTEAEEKEKDDAGQEA